jgi:hypothetical protein
VSRSAPVGLISALLLALLAAPVRLVTLVLFFRLAALLAWPLLAWLTLALLVVAILLSALLVLVRHRILQS